MKKIIAIIAAYTIAMGILAAAFAADVAAPKNPVLVTNNGAKGVVIFDHGKHAGKGIECAACHHKAAEGQYKCGSCHGADEKGATPSIKDAMHAKEKGVCYACHLKTEAVNKKKCADCHAG